MAIKVDSVSNLDPAAVAENEQFIVQLISEQFPELDITSASILRQLLIRPSGILSTVQDTEADRLQRSTSVLAVQSDPNLADQSIVDALMSNYQIERGVGTAVTGDLAVVVDTLLASTVTAGTVFTYDGRTFQTVRNIYVYTTASLVVDSDARLLQARADGNYWFTLPVVEIISGGAAVPISAEFSTEAAITGFVSASAASEFAAGTSDETNEAMISRYAEGIAATAAADRTSISRIIRSAFPSVQDISVIGSGDPEMVRDTHNIFGISSGGKVDVYVRTASTPPTFTMPIIFVPDSLIDPSVMDPFYTGAYTTARGMITIPPTLVPGFYRAEAPAELVGIPMTLTEALSRGIYIDADATFTPVFSADSDARYTPYQGAAKILMTLLNYSPTRGYKNTGGASTLYTMNGEADWRSLTDLSASDWVLPIRLRYVPYLNDIQTFMNDRGRQASDLVVKAPHPCFVSVSVTVGYNASTTPPDIAEIKTVISATINALKFSEPALQGSFIVDAISDAFSNAYAILPVTLSGIIYLPDMTQVSTTSNISLTVPDYPALGVSRRTTAFYCYPENITVTLQAVKSKDL
jgi:hypothetical protein